MDVELNRLFEKVAGYFTLLGEPTRLKILNALCEAERSVGEIVTHT
ncbi:MAG: ArsR family transcriptional regulator, partial [Burkholderiales bacterium]|nr:ArsR family transcriptional regulator [Burkholderiales bacterium]